MKVGSHEISVFFNNCFNLNFLQEAGVKSEILYALTCSIHSELQGSRGKKWFFERWNIGFYPCNLETPRKGCFLKLWMGQTGIKAFQIEGQLLDEKMLLKKMFIIGIFLYSTLCWTKIYLRHGGVTKIWTLKKMLKVQKSYLITGNIINFAAEKNIKIICFHNL